MSDNERAYSPPATAPEDSFDPILPQLVGRDMTGVYRQFGGMSTALGRQMYAMYNKEEAAGKRAAAREQLATAAARAGKVTATPQEQREQERRAKYDEVVARKQSYQAPLPVPKAAPGPRFTRLDLVPHRKTGAAIAREQQAERAAELRAHNAGGARGAVAPRGDRIQQLQESMEGVTPTTGPVAAPAAAVRARRAGGGGSVGGRRAFAAPATEEERLFNAVLAEIKEREEYVAKMRRIKGPGFRDPVIEREIKERLEELKQLNALCEGAD
jgi:hypothetical protein